MITTQHRALPFHFNAALGGAAAWPCRAMPTLCMAMLRLCFPVLHVTSAMLRSSMPLLNPANHVDAFPTLCRVKRCRGGAAHCPGVPVISFHCNSRAVLLTSWPSQRHAKQLSRLAVHSLAPGPDVHGRAVPSHRFAKEFIATAQQCLASPTPRLALRCLALPLHGTLPARRVRCISGLVYAGAARIGATLCPRRAVASHATPCRCVCRLIDASPKPCIASRGYTMTVHCNDGHIQAMRPRCVGRRCIAGAIQCLVLPFQCVA